MIENLGIWIAAIVALIVLWFILYFIPIGLWFSALVSGVRISLLQLVLMRFRKVPPAMIVNPDDRRHESRTATLGQRSGSPLLGRR